MPLHTLGSAFMMRTLLILLGAMLLLPALASADTTFTLVGDLTNGGTFNGQLSIQSGGLTHVSGTYTNGSYSFTLPASYLGEDLNEGNFFLIDAFPVPAPQFDVSLYIPTTNRAAACARSTTTSARRACTATTRTQASPLP